MKLTNCVYKSACRFRHGDSCHVHTVEYNVNKGRESRIPKRHSFEKWLS